jgi:hypothetical protein
MLALRRCYKRYTTFNSTLLASCHAPPNVSYHLGDIHISLVGEDGEDTVPIEIID